MQSSPALRPLVISELYFLYVLIIYVCHVPGRSVKYTYPDRAEGHIINKKEIVKILKKAGWIETDLGNGSHIVFIHPETGGRTVVPNNKGKDIPKGTLAAIRRQTGINDIR